MPRKRRDRPPAFSRDWRPESEDKKQILGRGLRFLLGIARVNWPLVTGALIVGLIALIAAVGPEIAPRDPLEENAIININGTWKMPPFPSLTPGFPLGSDQFGRDLFSRLLWAVRPTMVMVTVVAITRLGVGVIFGLCAGWFTGWLGRVLDAIIGVALSIPVLMVALGAIAAVGVEAGIWAFIIGLSINGWVETARMVREQTRIVKGQLYIEAARALGASGSQVIFRHIVRQIMPMAWMLFAFEISGTLMVTAALGFLGYYIGGDVWVTVTDTTARRISGAPELGQMLATSWARIDEPWAMIAVGSVIFIAVLGFNLLGRGLRARLSVKRMSHHSLPARVREVVSTRVRDPARQWIEQRIRSPLARQTKHRAFYPVAISFLVVITGVLVGWRIQTTRQTKNALAALGSKSPQLWSNERGDPQGTLWSMETGPVDPEIQWVFSDPAGFSGGPAISEDGTVYVTSKEGTLYAVNAAGKVQWKVSLSSPPVGTPALDAQGQIYVTDATGSLSVFTLAGELGWRFQAEPEEFATSGPIVAIDGTVYYMLRGSTVQAVSSSGEGLWKTRVLDNPIYSPPRLSADGDWLFVKDAILDSHDGSVQAWSRPLDVDQFMLGANGLNYLQSGNDIYQWHPAASVVETDRSATWNYRQYTVRAAGGPTDVGITPQQLVWLLYSSSREDTRIVWVEMGGGTKGNSHLAQRRTEVIAVDSDGITYLCGWSRSGGAECMALEPGADNPVWTVLLDEAVRTEGIASSLTGSQSIANPKIGGGALVPGRLYVALEDGFLFAIGEGQPLQIAGQGSEPAKATTKPLGPDSEDVAWVFEDSSGFPSRPTVSPEGAIYIAASDGTLYALDPAGNTMWEAPLPAPPVAPAALSQTGDVYQADKEGNLSAFAPDGSLRWRFQPLEPKSPTAGPVVGPEGNIYYTLGNSVQAVSPEGNGLWQTQAKTFRNYTPLQPSPTGGLLFFADDVFDTSDGKLLELDAPVKVDHFFVGKDSQSYLRSQHTVMPWRLNGSSVEIIQSAQWNHEGLVYSDGAPTETGITQDGTIWLMYTTPWGSDTLLVWITVDGEILGTTSIGTTAARFNAAQIIGVLDQDATAYLCGFKNRPQSYSPATVQCSAFPIGSEEPVWQVELDKSEEIKGGALGPGRLYLATREGLLYAIGKGQPLQLAARDMTPTGPADANGAILAPPAAEIAWVFEDPSGFAAGPAASASGVIYIASKDGTFYALDRSGNTLWEMPLPAAPVGPPALNATGTIFQADKEGNLSAFSPDGSLYWRFQPTESKPSTVGPLVDPNGTIYYTIGGSVQAVSPDGEGLWQTRSKTFRSLIPFQLDTARELLFYADDAFSTSDGALLELESLVNADQYIAGNDGNLYLRDEHTVMQWERNDSKVEIIQSAQWDYASFVGGSTPPDAAGVTVEGVIWIAYTEWSGSCAWLDPTGQVLGAVHYGLYRGQIIKVLDDDGTAFACGTENPNSSRTRPKCKAISPKSTEPIWEIALETGEGQPDAGNVVGGTLVSGRLYAATDRGLLFAIGESVPSAQAVPSEAAATTPTPQAESEQESQESVLATPEPSPTPATIPADSMIAGSIMTYTIPVINFGPSDATGVVVTDTLSAGLTFISAIASQGAGCSESNGNIVCELGNVTYGARATITVVVTIDPLATGAITHTANVTSQSADPDSRDNIIDHTTTVRGPADLVIGVLDDPDPAVAGQPLTYTLSITNHGPGDASGVIVTSQLPISLTFVSATSDRALSCMQSDGGVRCELGDLAIGASARISILATIDPSMTGTILYSASVAAIEPDYNPLDNIAEEETTVNAEADLTVTR